MISFIIVLLGVLRAVSVFGVGSLSTDQVETSIALTPDEQTAFVSRHDGQWGHRENPPSKIYEYQLVNDRWELVGLSAFSDEESDSSDSDIFISYDGQEAFFISSRTYPGKEDNNQDIWRSTWSGDSWSEPAPIDGINSPGYEASPVTDLEGNLYFSSMRKEGVGLGDFYFAKRAKNGNFDASVLLAGEINGPSGEWNLVVSPDASWIIFESSGRSEGLSPYGDLYLSQSGENGWSQPIHLTAINTTGSELNPRLLTKSDKVLYVSSQKLENPTTDFYQIDTKELLPFLKN